MSISGMISMRARFFGIGEATRILIRRARHRKRDRYFNLCHASRFESPPPKRAHGGIVENRIADTLDHSRVRNAAAGRIDRDHADTTAHNVTASRFIWIFRSGSADCARLSLRGCRHAGRTRWTGNLRSFNRLSFGRFILLGWWSGFFMELRLDLRRRRLIRNRNVFRWRRGYILRRLVERSLDRCRRDIGVISGRRFFMKSDRHRDAVHRNGPTECGHYLPLGSGTIKKRSRSGHSFRGRRGLPRKARPRPPGS